MIDRLAANGAVTAGREGSRHDIQTVSIPAGEGDALRRWVLAEKATRTIEVGLAFGVSALHICEALVASGDPNARHVAIDPFQERSFANHALRVLADAGVESLVEHHAELSQLVLPAFLKEGRSFDFAFVDGNHRFDSVFLDLFYLGRLVRRGGVIALDDYDLPGIRRAVAFFVKNLGWRVEETSPETGARQWIVLRTAAGEDTRDFRYFVDF